MKSYINQTTVISAVAGLAGLFVYKKFVSASVVKALGGNA